MSPSRWAVDVAGPVQALLPAGFVVVATANDNLRVEWSRGRVHVLLDPGVSLRGPSGTPRAFAARQLAVRAAVRFRTLAGAPELVPHPDERAAYDEAAALLAPLRDGGVW